MTRSLRSALGWSGAQTAVRLAVGFASIKVTAVLLGPAGIALVGQVGNFLTLLGGTLGNAIQSAVTKMTAEAESRGEHFVALWRTALRLAAMLGGAVGLVIAMLSRPLAQWLLDASSLWPVIVLVGTVLPLLMVYLTLSGVLTGRRLFHLVAATNVGATVVGAAIFMALTFHFGLPGGLTGTALAYAANLAVIALVIRRARVFEGVPLGGAWSPALLRPIVAFYPMLLVHSAAAPLATLLVRDTLMGSVGADQAGLWQATLRLSEMYTQVLLTALSMYSLPTLAALREPTAFRREMFGMTLKMGAVTALAGLAIYLLRGWIVPFVFDARFRPVGDLLGWQLAGDVLKLAAWPLRSALMVQSRQISYMAVEAGAAVAQIALTHALLPALGLRAATVGYAATWALALLVLLALHARMHRPAVVTPSVVAQ